MLTQKLPFYLKYAVYLLNIILSITILYLGRDFLIPLCFGILFALLLLPLCKLIERIKVPRILAIFLTLIIVFSFVVLILMLLTSQFMSFADQMPLFVARINIIFNDVQFFFKNSLGISILSKYKNAQTGIIELLGSQAGFISDTLFVTTGLLINVGMVIVYTFFFLLYRSSFKEFVTYLFPKSNKASLLRVMTRIKKLVLSYILGVFSVISIIAILNSIGLLIIGIENAIFLGMLSAIFAIIPYIGVFIGAVFPLLIALLTKDSAWYAVGVAGLSLLVHLLEGNFITPYFVGRRVSINPLTAILGIIAGHMIWGISGMILSLPIIAIFKSIFDNVENLKPYGYMLGLEISESKPLLNLNTLFKRRG